MTNTALKTEKLYTVKEASVALNCTDRTVKRYCKVGKIKAITVIDNGGEQYRISEEALKEYALSNNIILPPSIDTIPKVKQGLSLSSKNTQLVNETFDMTSASSFSLVESKEVKGKVIPEKAREIGLARQDLLKAWSEFRDNADKKTQADSDFVNLYNTQMINIEIFNKLGKVSKGTLYRWKKSLEESKSYLSLIPNYKYQANTQKKTKLTETETKYLLDLLLQPSKVSVGNATRLVKYVVKKQGIIPAADITYRRFANWFKDQYYDTWVLMRQGQKALVDKVAPYVERNPAVLEVGDVLVADGHVLDFQVINPFSGKPCRATLVGYQDWKSTYFVGYEIMLTENTQNIASALRNSIINLGKIPKVCYQDNGRAFRAKYFNNSNSLEECGFYGLFGKLGIVPVFAQPYNAKAKVVERFFREFSETFEKLLPSYVGNSPINKPAHMMRNEKFHKSIHNEFVPTIEQAIELIERWLDFYRSQPCPNVQGQTIGEVFEAGRGEGVDLNLLDELMMAEDLRSVSRNGVKFLNNNYWSEELYGLKEKVVIKYSLFDLSSVKIYGTDGRFICNAETMLQVHPMAKALGDAKDVYSLKKAINTTKKLQNKTMKKAKELLPQLNRELLPYQKTEEVKKVTENKKISKKAEKDYGNISVDLSGIEIEEQIENEIPLFDWQIEEEQKRTQM